MWYTLSHGGCNQRGNRRTYAVKIGMNSPISIDSRLLAAELDDLAYDGHELADILVEIGAGDAGGGRVAVHFFLRCSVSVR